MSDKTNWSGSVWGRTTKGAVLAEMMRQGNRIEGKVVLVEPGFGQLQALLHGEWSDSGRLSVTLHQFTGSYNVAVTLPQNGKMEGQFHADEDVISGEWSTDTQTSGKFLLIKLESAQPIIPATNDGTASAPPPTTTVEPNAVIPSLNTKTVALGSYRLDEQGVRRLADVIKSGTNVAQPAINAYHNGSEHIHIGIDRLLADSTVPDVVYAMIVSANESSVNAGTRTVTLHLKQHDANTLFVSGYDRIWVEGKAAEIRDFLDAHQSKASFILRKYGANLNGIVFLVMLALLPSISSLRNRLIVVSVVFVLLFLLVYSWRLAANTKIFLRETKTTWYQKQAGWLLVLLEVILTVLVGYLIQRFITHH